MLTLRTGWQSAASSTLVHCLLVEELFPSLVLDTICHYNLLQLHQQEMQQLFGDFIDRGKLDLCCRSIK